MSEERSARQEIFDEGIRVRREVLGDSYVDASLAKAEGTLGEEMQQYVTRFVWGENWTRPILDKRSRSLINLGMLVALDQQHELSVHVRGAIRNGLTREEIIEAIRHATAYCGAPAGLAAARTALETFETLTPEDERYLLERVAGATQREAADGGEAGSLDRRSLGPAEQRRVQDRSESRGWQPFRGGGGG